MVTLQFMNQLHQMNSKVLDASELTCESVCDLFSLGDVMMSVCREALQMLTSRFVLTKVYNHLWMTL